MLSRHEANSQENNNLEGQPQQNRFGTLLKLHPCTDTPPKIRSIFTEHPPPGEHLWGTASVCKKNFKRLDFLKSFYLQLLK